MGATNRGRRAYLPMRITVREVAGKPVPEREYELHVDGTVYTAGSPARRIHDQAVIDAVIAGYHFGRLHEIAQLKGWARPSALDAHGVLPWVQYWLAMEARERARELDPATEIARPVPPHTPGRAAGAEEVGGMCSGGGECGCFCPVCGEHLERCECEPEVEEVSNG